MSGFGPIIPGKGQGVRCDGCGKFSRDPMGSYRRPDGSGNYDRICSWGRNCAHDFCRECEQKLWTAENQARCSKCGEQPDGLTQEELERYIREKAEAVT